MACRLLNQFLDMPILIHDRQRTYEDLKLVSKDPSVRVSKNAYVIHQVLKSESIPNGKVGNFSSPQYQSLSEAVTLDEIEDMPLLDAAGDANWCISVVKSAVFRKACIQSTALEALELTSDDIIRWKKSEVFSRVVRRLSMMRASGNNSCMRFESGGILWCGTQYCVVAIKTSKTMSSRFFKTHDAWIMGWEQLLCVKDIWLQRFNVYLAARRHPLLEEHQIVPLIDSQIAFQESAVRRYGNTGYEIAKSTEALMKSRLIQINDWAFAETGPIYRMLEKVRDKERDRGGAAPFVVDEYLDNVLSKVDDNVLAFELFGLQKLSGHPDIDARRVGNNYKKNGTKQEYIEPQHSFEIRDRFRLLYLEGYLAKHRRWPKLSFTPAGTKTSLYDMYRRGATHITRSRALLSELRHFKFNKHQDFDYHDDWLQLCDDKSIGTKRSEFKSIWDRSIETTSDRRLLVEVLTDQNFTARGALESMETGRFEKEDESIILFPKEKEMKADGPRGFSMMPAGPRTALAALESNLAQSILPLIADTTMTMTRNQVVERLLTLSDVSKEGDEYRLTVIIENDFESWNNFMRQTGVGPIALDLNDIFGVSFMYMMVHHFFINARFSVGVPSCPPADLSSDEPIDPDIIWCKNRGGCEGIAQKLWSTFTAAFTLYAQTIAEDLVDSMIAANKIRSDYTHEVFSCVRLIQGDNEIDQYSIVRNTQSAADQARDFRTVILAGLAEAARRAGQSIKPEECLESTNVATYSKEGYVKGAEVRTSLKAQARIFPTTPGELPSAASSIGGAIASARAAAERSYDPFSPYIIGLLQASLYLQCARRGTDHLTQSIPTYLRDVLEMDTARRRLLLLPASLGGLPVPTWADFLVKGAADPLSKDISAFLSLSGPLTSFPSCYVARLLKGELMKREPDLDRLIHEPYSLPLDISSGILSVTTDIAKNWLGSAVRNRQVEAVMKADTGISRSKFMASLHSITPFSPALFHDLYSSSVFGVIDNISEMFISTRTIQIASRAVSDDDIVPRLLQKGSQQLIAIAHAVTSPELSNVKYDQAPPLAGFVYAGELRKFWGVDIVGITAATEFDFKVTIHRNPVQARGTLAWIDRPQREAIRIRGGLKPYLGTPTAVKRSEHGFKIVGSGRPISALKRLQTIMSQSDGNSVFNSIVDYAAASRVGGKPLSTYTDLISVKAGGCSAHRYPSQVGDRGASPVVMTSSLSCCDFNTDLNYFAMGKDDYPIMIQGAISYALAIVSHIQLPQTLPGCFVVLDSDQHKLPMIIDEPLLGAVSPGEPPRVDSKLAYIPIVELRSSGVQELRSRIGASFRADSSPAAANCIMRSHIRRALDAGRIASAIAERSQASITLSIDLLEVYQAGIRRLIRSAGEEIAKRVIADQYVLEWTDVRWSFDSEVPLLAGAVAQAVSKVCDHPSVWDSQSARSLGIQRGMRYTPGLSFTGQIKAAIVQEVYLFIKRIKEDPRKSFEVCFLDDSPQDAIRCLVREILLRAQVGVMRGYWTQSEALGMMREYILNWQRNHDEAVVAFDSISISILALSSYFSRTEGRFDLASLFSLVANDLIVSSDLGLREASRTLRTVLIDIPPVHLSQYQTIEQTSRRASRISTRGSLEARMLRLNGRVYGGSATSLRSFSACRLVFGGASVVIIGSGHGAAAAVALESGALSVVGYDRQADLTRGTIIRTDHIPDLVRFCANESRYSQASVTYDPCFDLNQWSQLCEVISSHQNGAVFVYDAELTHDTVTVVEAFFAYSGLKSRVVVRIVESPAKVQSQIKKIAGAYDVDVYPVFLSDHIDEVVLVVSASKSLVRKRMRIIDPECQLDIGPGAEYVLRDLFPLLPYSTSSLEELLEIVSTSLDVGRSSKDWLRFASKDWTSLLHSSVVLSLLLSNDPVGRSLAVVSKECVCTNGLEVRMTEELIRKITKVMPRLLQ